MPKISALGGMSSRGFGEFAQQTAANYIEDVFSTYLYTGNGSTQTITNGIDLAGKGGLVWIKTRNQAYANALINTISGAGKWLSSNLTNAEMSTSAGSLDSFLSNGFSTSAGANVNENTTTYASWTFRKAPKFFDVVTYTGNETDRAISHGLGSVPGMIIIKATSSTGNWTVKHRSLATSGFLKLNTTAAVSSSAFIFPSNPTSSEFYIGTSGEVNSTGVTYVAYLFAHNAGGFGVDGSQNVISCGSFTTDGSGNASVTLGYEPQYVLIKTSSASSSWYQFDNMRGMSMTTAAYLSPNNSNAEASGDVCRPSATGFSILQQSASTSYIYMAIRRGPMRTPTDATKVFTPISRTGTGAAVSVTSFGSSPDAVIIKNRANPFSLGPSFNTRLINRPWLSSSGTGAETSPTASNDFLGFDIQNGYRFGTQNSQDANNSSYTYINYGIARAPGFFDVVCYTGSSPSAQTIAHNLSVQPELIIVKSRNSTGDWFVWNCPATGTINWGKLNTTSAFASDWFYYFDTRSATNFSPYQSGVLNTSGTTYVAYLFASCPGVSKVGTYTGTGATQTISCGFTGGARYVLIKRTDTTGSWWVWDTARGMVAGTDPRLAYNSTAAELNNDWVYTTTGGFQIVTSDATVNASGGTYIYLAIA